MEILGLQVPAGIAFLVAIALIYRIAEPAIRALKNRDRPTGRRPVESFFCKPGILYRHVYGGEIFLMPDPDHRSTRIEAQNKA